MEGKEGSCGICVKVQKNVKVRGGGAVLLNYVWYSALVELGYVTSKIIKLNFPRIKVCAVLYGPTEGNEVKKSKVSGVMTRVFDIVGNRYRLCVMGLHWLVWGGYNWAFGVLSKNEN